MNDQNEREWSRLDNAAKIFPPNVSGHDTKVFRFACQLKEDVQPQLLQQAAEDTLKLFPIFRSVMKQGLFWCYLEESDQLPQVREEYLPPCAAIYDPSKRNLLFRVTYYRRRINLEVFHAITDGTGALHFLRTMVSRYLQLAHSQVLVNVPVVDYEASLDQRGEDSFLKYYDPAKKEGKPKWQKAYRIHKELLPEGRLQVLEGIMPVKEIIGLSKQYGVTMSVFLTAILLQSIGEGMPVRFRKRPVVSAVPVNLRNFFPSGTARNFFALINVGYRFDTGSGQLEDILATVKQQFDDALDKEKMAARIGQMASLERNPILRIVPWVIKKQALRLANRVAQQYNTTSFSNLGRITMPEELDPYIERFDVFVSTDRVQICLCSYKDQLVISTTSSFVDTQIQTRFFRKLTEMGVHVQIDSNLQKEESES